MVRGGSGDVSSWTPTRLVYNVDRSDREYLFILKIFLKKKKKKEEEEKWSRVCWTFFCLNGPGSKIGQFLFSWSIRSWD